MPVIGGIGGRANPHTTHPDAGIAANTQIKTFRDHKIKSYEQAERALNVLIAANYANPNVRRPRQGGGLTDWPLASNVYLRQGYSIQHERDYIAVVLYDTEIVRYYDDETFSADNGGFNTPTTSNRITQFTPDRFFFWHHQKKLRINAGGWTPEAYEATHAHRYQVHEEDSP